jgi:hypothetical protein
MEQLELAVIGLLLFFICLSLFRLISKVEDCSIEMRKINKGMSLFSEIPKLISKLKFIEKKLESWEKSKK